MYLRVGEQIAAAQQNLALFVLLEDLGAVRGNIGQQDVVVFVGEAVEGQAGVDDELQDYLLGSRV